MWQELYLDLSLINTTMSVNKNLLSLLIMKIFVAVALGYDLVSVDEYEKLQFGDSKLCIIDAPIVSYKINIQSIVSTTTIKSQVEGFADFFRQTSQIIYKKKKTIFFVITSR